MKSSHTVLTTLIIAVSAATGSSFFAAQKAEPCFLTGSTGYRIADRGPANYTVRIDNAAAHPGLRMQVVDNPAAADFLLIDDSKSAGSCRDATEVTSIRIDSGVPHPDLTVSLSRAPADHKIYVRSANFSERDAAALLAVIWRNAQDYTAGARKVVARNQRTLRP